MWNPTSKFRYGRLRICCGNFSMAIMAGDEIGFGSLGRRAPPVGSAIFSCWWMDGPRCRSNTAFSQTVLPLRFMP